MAEAMDGPIRKLVCRCSGIQEAWPEVDAPTIANELSQRDQDSS